MEYFLFVVAVFFVAWISYKKGCQSGARDCWLYSINELPRNENFVIVTTCGYVCHLRRAKHSLFKRNDWVVTIDKEEVSTGTECAIHVADNGANELRDRTGKVLSTSPHLSLAGFALAFFGFR